MSEEHGWRVLSRMRLLLLATTVVATSMALPAAAQNPPTAQSASKNISIPAGPLTPALNRLAAQTGIQILFDASLAKGRTTQGAQGNMTPNQALSAVLAGTGLGARATGPNAITIVGPAAAGGPLPPGAILLDTIDVQGAGNPNSTMTPMPAYAGGQVATGGQLGFLGNRSIMDTPFNQTSYTQKTIQDQQARTVVDVLENDPSVRTAVANGGLDSIYIRGFLVNSSDASLNGLYGIVPSQTTSANFLERVEIIKGPSALLNGMPPGGSVGGSVNLVTKHAADVPITQLTTTYASTSNVGSQIDLSRRFGDAKEFGIRFNGAYHGGKTAIDDQTDAGGDAALALDYRGERFRLAADFIYQDTKLKPFLRPIAFLGTIPIPAPPGASTNYLPNWYYVNYKDTIGMVQGEVDVTDNITAYAAVGAHENRLSGIYQAPSSVNARGDFTQTPVTQSTSATFLAWQTGIRANVDTGPVGHAINVNYSDLDRENAQGPGVNGTAFQSNIYSPRNIPEQYLAIPDPRKAGTLDLSSVGVADTMSILDKRIQVTVGVRRQQVTADAFSTTTGLQTSSYDQFAWSPAYAIVVKPWENVSLYANYIEGLQQGSSVISTAFANYGEVFPPYQSKQKEAGVKIDWGRVTTTASVFDISQPSLISVPGTPLPSQSLDGEARNRGIEFNVFGEVARGVRVLGGVMFMDGEQVKTANGTNDGKRPIGVPNFQANLGAEWDTPFIDGLSLNGRVIHTGDQYVDAANRQSIPAWTRLDLGARYTFDAPWNKKPITVRFAVENVFNKSYWASVFGGVLAQGQPRTYLVSTTFNF